jgi:small redox-active disulfide protein 2
MLTIKVLGSGCANCKKLDALAHQAAESIGLQAEFIKVTEYPEIMKYNVMSTPGLVINEKLVSAGRIPSVEQIVTWLADAEMAGS